jgi:hypothetical protein
VLPSGGASANPAAGWLVCVIASSCRLCGTQPGGCQECCWHTPAWSPPFEGSPCFKDLCHSLPLSLCDVKLLFHLTASTAVLLRAKHVGGMQLMCRCSAAGSLVPALDHRCSLVCIGCWLGSMLRSRQACCLSAVCSARGCCCSLRAIDCVPWTHCCLKLAYMRLICITRCTDWEQVVPSSTWLIPLPQEVFGVCTRHGVVSTR